ncbi:MAG: hypothetical protein M3450_12805 [Actinomycetota bacterium]|nr:hypothetical protein [Actinomycetota bacterium]
MRDWHEASALRGGLDIGTATDLLWLHCGDDVYAGLGVGCGWPRQEIEIRARSRSPPDRLDSGRFGPVRRHTGGVAELGLAGGWTGGAAGGDDDVRSLVQS